MKYRSYVSSSVELFDRGKNVIVHNLTDNRYYSIAYDAVPKTIKWNAYVSKLKIIHFAIYLALFAVTISYSISRLWIISVSSFDGHVIALILVFLFVNILLHESAHIVALRYFGRRPDKLGFKMTYRVLPAIYVRTNQSLLLPRREQFIVHSAGLFVNSAVCMICILLIKLGLLPSIWQIVVWSLCWFILFNLLPILNTDGQKILMACLGHIETKRWKDKAAIERIITFVSLGVLALLLCRAVWLISIFLEHEGV